MDDIYNVLSAYLKSNRNGVNETIAHYMLVYLNQIPKLRAVDVADCCHTSASSVVRFCRELGYEGYIEFKNVVDDYCQNVQDKYLVPHIPLAVLGSDDQYADSLRKWTQVMQEFAFCAILALDRKQIMRLAQEILQYRYVYIFGAGLSAQIAEHLRIRLARSGKIILTMAAPHMEMPLTSSRVDTLAIVISQHGYGMRPGSGNEGLLDYLQKYCNKTWLVTQESPQRVFHVDETVHIISSSDFEMEFHTMIYFEEVLGEYCQVLINENGQDGIIESCAKSGGAAEEG